MPCSVKVSNGGTFAVMEEYHFSNHQLLYNNPFIYYTTIHLIHLRSSFSIILLLEMLMHTAPRTLPHTLYHLVHLVSIYCRNMAA